MEFDLDEIIKKEKELYEYNKKIVDTHIVFEDVLIEEMYCDDTELIEEALERHRYDSKYHKQIYQFLELLKWYQKSMEDIPDESGVLQKAVYSDGYNKALEDYHRLIADEIKNDPVNPYLLHLYNFNNHIKKCLTKR